MIRALCVLAFSVMATHAPAFGQPKLNDYVSEKLDQRERSLAKAGGDAAKSAFNAKGLAGIGQLSSDCMESVNAGKQSPHYCLGVEATSQAFMAKASIDTNNKVDVMAKNWFSAEKQKNRILAYCIIFLRTTEQRCGDHYAAAKMAVE